MYTHMYVYLYMFIYIISSNNILQLIMLNSEKQQVYMDVFFFLNARNLAFLIKCL